MACSLSAHTTYNISLSCEHAFTKQATELDFRLLHELASGCHGPGFSALGNEGIFCFGRNHLFTQAVCGNILSVFHKIPVNEEFFVLCQKHCLFI